MEDEAVAVRLDTRADASNVVEDAGSDGAHGATCPPGGTPPSAFGSAAYLHPGSWYRFVAGVGQGS
jgi:hypothetical protein